MQRPGRARFATNRPGDGWHAVLDDPAEIRDAERLADVPALVQWVDAETRRGRWGVLLLTYESAPAFDEALRVSGGQGPVPHAWAAVYDRADVDTPPSTGTDTADDAVAWTPAITEERFARDIGRILDRIHAGDTYQVNYTFPLAAPFPHDPWRWFARCAAHADVPFAAAIDIGASVVLSFSPELFLQRRGARVTTRPMKGTTRRGRWLAEDERLARDLSSSDKARAENVMIVDLLRNDLGRVATTGSVVVTELCRLERYPTVWQLTSTVEADVPRDLGLLDLMRALFPCGSVTGAPKVSTMSLIADLETAPRGVYTGAIVLLQPGGDFVASVPIRTVVLDRQTGIATFGVGAGITADSVAAEEWAECLAKSRVVRPPAVPDDAALFETLRLQDGLVSRRAGHVTRLRSSAALFGWPDPGQQVDAAIDEVAMRHPAGIWRLRVVADRSGQVHAEATAFTLDTGPWRVGLAATPVDTRSPLLFNKTTRRDVYEAALAARPGVDDVLLWNRNGELTESTRANLIVEIDGDRVTPPIACGLLPGVFRQELLTRGDVVERVVRVDQLERATRLWLVNSLREWIDVELVVPS